MKGLIVVLVYLAQSGSAWKDDDRREYPMPDMTTCQKAVETAKIAAQKGSVAIFCAYKENQ